MDGFDDTPREPPQDLLDMLAQGEEDAAAGRVIPWPTLRARLHALQAELEAKRARPTA